MSDRLPLSGGQSAGQPYDPQRAAVNFAEQSARLRAPYHEAVSWTYYTQSPEKMEEALLRIRRALKEAIGWWNDSDAQAEREAFDRLGIKS